MVVMFLRLNLSFRLCWHFCGGNESRLQRGAEREHGGLGAREVGREGGWARGRLTAREVDREGQPYYRRSGW
jgi:hypothetical protein